MRRLPGRKLITRHGADGESFMSYEVQLLVDVLMSTTMMMALVTFVIVAIIESVKTLSCANDRQIFSSLSHERAAFDK